MQDRHKADGDERFWALTEGEMDWFWEVDANGVYTWCSPKAEDVLGYRPEEIVRKAQFDFMTADDEKRMAAWFRTIAKARKPFERLESNFVHKNGEQIVVESSGVPVFDDDDSLLGYRGIARDITERARTVAALRKSEARLNAAQEKAKLGCWEHDPGTGEGYWSKQMCRLFYRDLGAPFPGEEQFLELVHPDDRAAVKSSLQRLYEERGRVVSQEYRTNPANGPMRYLEAVSHAVEKRNGDVTFLGTVQDITARRHAEEERRELDSRIQHAQKLESLGVLAGGIAHDFNNLLTGILGNSELALSKLSPESPAREFVQQAQKTAVRAADLTKQLLAYSGRGELIVEPLSLNKLVEEMAHLMEVSIAKHTRLEFNLTPGIPAIAADATQVRQVIMNLITNASEAIGSKKGRISITTGVVDAEHACQSEACFYGDLREGAYVYIEVADTGGGMDAETQARVFDPFFTTKFAGHGLGLASLMGIVRGHRGAVKLRSEPGKGTTFTVLFPASEQRAEAGVSRSTAEPFWRSTGTILVVDPQKSVRDVASRMLEQYGFTPLTAPDGRVALRIVSERSKEIAAVLLDLTMHKVDGEDVFVLIRRMIPKTPILLMSGYNQRAAVGRLASGPRVGFISKPFQLQQFIGKVRDVLERRQGERRRSKSAPPVERRTKLDRRKT